MAETKYYDTDQAVKMLPLIKAYCRDIRDNWEEAEKLVAEMKRLAGMTALSRKRKEEIQRRREEIRSLLSGIKKRYMRWKIELGEMFVCVCDPKLGRVDVPVFCDEICAAISFCVTPETEAEDIEWHQPGECCDKAKPYFVEVA